MKKYLILLICLLILTGCASAITKPSSSTSATPTKIVLKTLVPSPSSKQTLQLTPTLTLVPTPIMSPTLQPLGLPGPVIIKEPGPYYETIIQIPVGEEGIQYRGAGVQDMQPVGPNGLVVTEDGTIIVGDASGNRLIRYDGAGNRLEDIDLASLGILNISDFVEAGDQLYILEISFNTLPERYRVNQLTIDGTLVRQYDLPEGFHFEDGLFGLSIGYLPDSTSQVLIQLDNADNSTYYKLSDTANSPPEKLPGKPVFGTDFQIQSAGLGELAVSYLGRREFESQMTTGGAIFLLAARADASLYLERQDLLAWEPVVTTDITIHYISPGGEQAGVARYPLSDWYFYISRFLTIGPDGNVYALITRQASVDVLRLNFYSELEPLIPDAAKPSIASLTQNPIPEVTHDCLSVQHHLPNTPEAQQIVQSFIATFKEDWPTEYMAFEQLWSVDQLGQYAVIQGLVTQEESDVIVTQETDQGFVMLARYQSHMVLPGFRHEDISGYLQAQVPEAPPELFSCLDLSRFGGKSQ